ncbi:hypothetical protein CCUS01_16941 [Colletotrichum cuscutae]|uniref:Uncharacterized protein n=1 Tax=Colletotrichum cuscutae TaxID=1209917 RepID=A0AAI9V8F2_9PEZI|nr:hypothetical protein CCUS01_16941 [Colletotrichum cuscutae]
MPSQELRSSENISAITSQGPTRYHERRNDDEPNQHRLETALNVTGKDKGSTEASSAESSVQNPPSSSKECVIKRFWSKQFSVVVEFETCRDHLGTFCACPAAVDARFRIRSTSRLSSENPFRIFIALLLRPDHTRRWWDVTVPDLFAPDDQSSNSLHGLVTPDTSLLCVQNSLEIVIPDRPIHPESFFPRYQNSRP